MKTFQIKFKTQLIILIIGLTVVSCRNGKEEDATKSNTDTNSEQVNTSTTSISAQDNKTSITPDENGLTSPDSPKGNTAPVILDCNYFKEHPNTVLKDNPEADVDYIITCVMRVDGKLTIEPGVVIAFEQDAGMEFKEKSSFKMEGTAEKPILLTGKEKTKGFWSGIHTESPSSNNIMRYVTIDYAGGNAPRGGSKAGLGIYRESSNLTIDHCTVSNSKYTGMVVKDKVGKDIHNISMKNCTFTKNNIPVQSHASRLRMYNGTNSFSGNDKDYIQLDGGDIYGDATWAKLDVPYFLQGNFKNNDGVLTVEPGTEIIMPAQSAMHVSNKSSLVMAGTADDLIIIRGEHDVPGFWSQLTIDSSSPLNKIAFVNIKNAGMTTGTPNGAIRLQRSKYLKIHDVVFGDCFEYAISLNNSLSSPLHLEHANLTLDNTPKLISDWKGTEVSNPEKS